MKQVKEELLAVGIHRMKLKEVGLYKGTYEDSSEKYYIKETNSKESYGNSTSNELNARGQFSMIAFGMEEWKKVKDIPNSDWQANARVIKEWDNKIPSYEIVNNEF